MRSKQLSLAVKIYHVEIYQNARIEITRQFQAATPGAAKYALYKSLRDAGYFDDFIDYLKHKPVVKEIRK